MSAIAPPSAAGNLLPPPEVIELAGHRFSGRDWPSRFIGHEPLKRSVHRLWFEAPTGSASVVVKHLSRRRARVNELVVRRWLPAVGLDWVCPALLGFLEERSGSAVWHIYEDVPGRGLDRGAPDPERVGSAVELIADLHTRFARHPLLIEPREHGVDGDLGMAFFTNQVARSIDALRSIGSLRPSLPREHAELKERLLRRMERLWGERHERALLVHGHGGPDTLLHGDLWTSNARVVERGGGFQARLIDWDHVGVGPVTYDLSTFLYRFPRGHRPWILRRYREEAGRRGWGLPDDSTLNVLFETAEYARYACCLAGPALAASRSERWGFEQLAEVERWFDSLEPVLGVDGGR